MKGVGYLKIALKGAEALGMDEAASLIREALAIADKPKVSNADHRRLDEIKHRLAEMQRDENADRLIHWSGARAGQCARKDSTTDQEVTFCSSGATIIQTGNADHIGNVTCPRCRAIWMGAK